MLEQLGRQRVVGGQFGQHLFVGGRRAAGGLLLHRQAELAEQDLADLLGAAQVEGLAGEFVRLALQRHHAFGQLLALPGEHGRVDQHAVALDAAEHHHAGHLDLFVDEQRPGLLAQLRPQHLVHVQRHVAVFAGVLGGALHLDLRERDLVDALAAHVFVAQAAAPEVARGQALQAVRLVRLEHVALQHGVVRIASHHDAGIGEHMRVVLDVLAELERLLVLEPGLQRGQHLGDRQLIRRVGIAVRERDVGRLADRHRQRDADDARRHAVERIGLGVDGGQRRMPDAFQPALQRLVRQHRFVVLVDARRRRRRGGRRVVTFATEGSHGRRAHRRFEILLPGLEAEAAVEVEQALAVHRLQRQRVERGEARYLVAQVAVGHHRDQPFPGRQPVERLAQVLAGHTLDRRGGGDHAVERAVFGDPLGGRLRADLLDAGHVVDGVAHQRQVVDDALRRHAELGQHAGHVEPLVAHRVDQRDVLVDQLRQVLVAGGDDHLVAAGRGQARQRADGVVGLDARRHQHRPAEQLHHLVDRLDLPDQVFGHRRALRLVLGVPLVAEGVALGIEHAGRVLGLHVLQRALEHGHHAVDGAGREAVGAAQVGQRVVGAVQVARAVHQQQGLRRHGGIVSQARRLE